jgi:hypothetical protein
MMHITKLEKERLAATRNAVVAFELRAIEPVGHFISGPARQAWTATRIHIERQEGYIPDRRGWTVNSKPGLRQQPG